MTGQLIGVALIVVGVLVAIFGDRKVGAQGGIVLKAVSMPGLSVKILKWVVVLVCLGLGVALVIGGGRL